MKGGDKMIERLKKNITVKCPVCGYVKPVVDNGKLYCPYCGTDLTEKVREIDPELVEEISHSSIYSIDDKLGEEKEVRK